MTRLKGKVTILAYHRVVTEKERNQYYIQPGMYVRDDVFEKQMSFLRDHFNVLSFSELLFHWKERKWDKKERYCVITFDDGWLDNYTYAYPVLKNYDLPATIFLPTAFVDTVNWFWPDQVGHLLWHYYKQGPKQRQNGDLNFIQNRYPRLLINNGKTVGERIDSAIEGCKGLPAHEVNGIIEDLKLALNLGTSHERMLLNWSEIEEMSRHNISFGSHSCRHEILTNISPDAARKEIEESRRVLREKRLNFVPVFCYPNGNYNPNIAGQVKAAGYEAAVTTHYGFEDASPRDIYGLKRIGIHNDMSSTIPLFASRLSGLF